MPRKKKYWSDISSKILDISKSTMRSPLISRFWALSFFILGLLPYPFFMVHAPVFLMLAVLPFIQNTLRLWNKKKPFIEKVGQSTVGALCVLVCLNVLVVPTFYWVLLACYIIVDPNSLDDFSNRRSKEKIDALWMGRLFLQGIVLGCGFVGFGFISWPIVPAVMLNVLSWIAVAPMLYEICNQATEQSGTVNWLGFSIKMGALLVAFGVLPMLPAVSAVLPFIQLSLCIYSTVVLAGNKSGRKAKKKNKSQIGLPRLLTGLLLTLSCGAIGFQWIPVLSTYAVVFQVMTVVFPLVWFLVKTRELSYGETWKFLKENKRKKNQGLFENWLKKDNRKKAGFIKKIILQYVNFRVKPYTEGFHNPFVYQFLKKTNWNPRKFGEIVERSRSIVVFLGSLALAFVSPMILPASIVTGMQIVLLTFAGLQASIRDQDITTTYENIAVNYNAIKNGLSRYFSVCLRRFWAVTFLTLSVMPYSFFAPYSSLFVVLSVLPSIESILFETSQSEKGQYGNILLRIIPIMCSVYFLTQGLTGSPIMWGCAALCVFVNTKQGIKNKDEFGPKRVTLALQIFFTALGLIGFGVVSIPILPAIVLKVFSMVSMVPLTLQIILSNDRQIRGRMKAISLTLIKVMGVLFAFGVAPLPVPGLLPIMQLVVCVGSAGCTMEIGDIVRKRLEDRAAIISRENLLMASSICIALLGGSMLLKMFPIYIPVVSFILPMLFQQMSTLFVLSPAYWITSKLNRTQLIKNLTRALPGKDVHIVNSFNGKRSLRDVFSFVLTKAVPFCGVLIGGLFVMNRVMHPLSSGLPSVLFPALPILGMIVIGLWTAYTIWQIIPHGASLNRNDGIKNRRGSDFFNYQNATRRFPQTESQILNSISSLLRQNSK